MHTLQNLLMFVVLAGWFPALAALVVWGERRAKRKAGEPIEPSRVKFDEGSWGA